MTQSQIATELGISQMHVSRLLARTLAQLREGLTTDERAQLVMTCRLSAPCPAAVGAAARGQGPLCSAAPAAATKPATASSSAGTPQMYRCPCTR